MKRILVILALLGICVGAFAVSGKIFMRYGNFEDQSDGSGTKTIGPMWSFWGADNNVDLWQNQNGGTGFEVNFDSFGLIYKTRENHYAKGKSPDGFYITDLYYLNTGGYKTMDRWGTDGFWAGGAAPADLNNYTLSRTFAPATSPGYIQVKNLKLGNIDFNIGLAWWTLMGSRTDFSTNGTTTNWDAKSSVSYNRFYVDGQFSIPVSDAVQIKIVDWDRMHSEFYFGNSANTGNFSGTYITNAANVGGFSIYVPLRVMINLDPLPLNLDIAPRLYYTTSTVYQDNTTTTNKMADNFMRAGAYARVTYGINDVLSAYLFTGFFYDNGAHLSTTGTAAGTVTNLDAYYPGAVADIYGDTKTTGSVVPLYVGLKVKIGTGISANIGYGWNFMLNYTKVETVGGAVTNTTTYGTVARTGWMKNDNGNTPWQVAGVSLNEKKLDPELQTFGDTLMDVSFLKFGADAKFAQFWTLGIKGAVSLNDGWNHNFENTGSVNTKTVTSAAGGQNYDLSMNNMFVFHNWQDYDNNMYIKYEDDVVMIKATFDSWTRARIGGESDMFGVFSYMDFAYKF